MNKITAYLSHAIRGAKGEKATVKEMRFNNTKAIIIANMLRERYPFLDIYVPAENADFDLVVWSGKYLTTEQILEIDCKILEKKDVLLVFDWCGTSSGMQVEIDHANSKGINIISFRDLDDAHYELDSFFDIN